MQHHRATHTTVVTPPVVVRQQTHGTRVCQWCKEAIKRDALICPHCRREQKAESINQGLFLCLGAVLILVLLGGILLVNIKTRTDVPQTTLDDLYRQRDSSVFDLPSDPTPPEVAPLE